MVRTDLPLTMIEVLAAGPIVADYQLVEDASLSARMAGVQYTTWFGALARAQRMCDGPAWITYLDERGRAVRMMSGIDDESVLVRTLAAVEVVEPLPPPEPLPPDTPKPTAPAIEYVLREEDFIFGWGNGKRLDRGGYRKDLYRSSDGRWFFEEYGDGYAKLNERKLSEITADEAREWLERHDRLPLWKDTVEQSSRES